MRLKTTIGSQPKHGELVSGVSWATTDEVFSAADDTQIMRWNLSSGEAIRVTQLQEGVYPTDMQWVPRSGGPAGKKVTGGDCFVLAATDGRFQIILKSGKVEKSVQAHRGAVLSIRWSYDGNALVTSGEDGQVKIWSRSGMLRSTLSQNSVPVYCVCWGPDSDTVLYTLGKQMVIKSLQANAKPNIWKGHDGVILKADWSATNGLIITGGEDCKYKLWDGFGRLLHVSSGHDYPITSIAWSPDGQLFAVGGYNTLRLCDQSGWSYSLDKPTTGSIFNLAWSSDSTQVAGACGNGHIIFGHVIGRCMEWRQLEARVEEEKVVKVRNVTDGSKEKLDFRDRVVKGSLGFNHLIIVTALQCHIYNIRNWNTPTIIELKEGSVTLVLQCEKNFLLVDGTGLYVYSYEGRLVSTIKIPGIRTEILRSGTCTISNDTIALKDKADEKLIFICDTTTGKPLGDGKHITHKIEVCELALDQCGPATDRKLAVVDKNRDLYLMTIRVYGTTRKSVKISTMVESLCWSDTCNILAAIGNGKLMVWYYPNAAFVDKELLPKTVFERDVSDFGKQPQLIAFASNQLSMRRVEGSLITTSISPHASVLHNFVVQNKWKEAIRLCRFVKDDILWACLAAMATTAKDLNTAEVAYAAINETDKVEYIQYVKNIPLKEVRNAEMILMSGNFQDAEGVLLQKGLIFRAIMLNITFYNWERALELALKNKTCDDVVIAFRRKYLLAMGRKEINKAFIQHSDKEIDFDEILQKVDEEYKKEKEQPDVSRPSTTKSQTTAKSTGR